VRKGHRRSRTHVAIVKNNLFFKDSKCMNIRLTPSKRIQRCFFILSNCQVPLNLSSCNQTCSLLYLALFPSTPSKMVFFSSQWSALSSLSNQSNFGHLIYYPRLERIFLSNGIFMIGRSTPLQSEEKVKGLNIWHTLRSNKGESFKIFQLLSMQEKKHTKGLK